MVGHLKAGYHLKAESQRLEDFEPRVHVKSSKFTFWTKYATPSVQQQLH